MGSTNGEVIKCRERPSNAGEKSLQSQNKKNKCVLLKMKSFVCLMIGDEKRFKFKRVRFFAKQSRFDLTFFPAST